LFFENSFTDILCHAGFDGYAMAYVKYGALK